MLVAVESPDLLSAETLQKLSEIASRLSRITGVREFGVTGLPTLPVDPLNPASSTVLDVLRAQPSVEARIAVLKDLPHIGRFLSADGTTTLIAVEVSRTASQTDVAAEVQAVQAHFEGPERIYVIGDHTVAQAIDSGIEADLSLLLPLACLLIFLSMRACFGTVRDAFLALCVCWVVWCGRSG
jgi:predicted RND superfamily exporter protein